MYLHAPPLSKSRYASFYNCRKKASTMTQAAVDWLKNHVVELSCTSNSKTFSILSIGCGDGEIDLQFISDLSKIILKRNQSLEYVAFEPNPLHYKSLKKRVEDFPFEKNVYIDIQQKAFCYKDEFACHKQFDLILFFHVLYYFSDPLVTIRSALMITKPGGKILIIHQTQKGIPEIQQRFMQHIKGNTNEMLTSEEIKLYLSQDNIPNDYFVMNAQLDVTECLNKSKTGIAIMSFCLECDLERIDDNKLNTICKAFKKQSVYKKQKYIIKEPIGIFIIPSTHDYPKIDIITDDQDVVNDYRVLAQHYDWSKLIIDIVQKKQTSEISILDVACGTGRWLQAFQNYVLKSKKNQHILDCSNSSISISYHFLDPSETSLKMAYNRPDPLITKGNQYNIKLQDAAFSHSEKFDIIWMMHGFYAIPKNEIRQAVSKLIDMLSDNGICFIAQAGRNAFYIDFYKQYCRYFNLKETTHFTSAEDIIEILLDMNISFENNTFNYNEYIDSNQNKTLWHYLFQECINHSYIQCGRSNVSDIMQFPDFQRIKQNKDFIRYLTGYLQEKQYRFPQIVCLCKILK